MGGLTAAVEIAAKKAKLDNYRLVELPALEDPIAQVMNLLTGDFKERVIRHELSVHYDQYLFMKQLLSSDRIQARLPYEISIH